MNDFDIGAVRIGNTQPLTVISGPCQLESIEHALMIARWMADACRQAGAQYIFKASYDKANRTSHTGKRGVGMKEGLAILAAVRNELGLPVLTDVHLPDDCAEVADAVDVLQIPAFLCRQTDLLLAAGQTGAAVNIKKGPFMAPWDIAHACAKIESTNNHRLLLTERGTSFGYNTLVADMRSLPIMAKTGYPVVMDATHAVQAPGGAGDASSGQREFAPALARAAVSLGIAAVFIETHEAPDTAPSDGPTMIALDDMPRLVETLMSFDRIAKSDPIIL